MKVTVSVCYKEKAYSLPEYCTLHSNHCLHDKSDCAVSRLERNGVLMRLDENILPTRFRFATVSPGELQRLRRVRNIVRRGRVAALDQASITFQSGERMELPEGTLVVDCSRNSTNWPHQKKIFDGDQINLQYVMLPPVGSCCI